jgi:pyridinium-3,5-biscarboxylic acid mononucleotide sulfurtransferase
MDRELAAKSAALTSVLEDLRNVVVAYSGGVDSSFLAASAHAALGSRSLAVTAVSPSLARRDLDDARALARARGWNHMEISTGEVDRDEYWRNEPDRCYWCKTELMEVLEPVARSVGGRVLVGTNADDLGDHRPGLRAAREHDARAPLAEVGLSKAEVRALSRELGLPTADKPASPCLASRFAYGVAVTERGLARVEKAEEALRALGFTELRVRDHGDLARVEVPRPLIERAAALADEISEALKALGYVYVSLDLTGFRSGAMNEVLAPPSIRAGRSDR